MTAYRTSTIKRTRRTASQIEEICYAIHQVLEEDHPQSVRHVFYRLTSPPYGLVAKTEAGYRTVQAKLVNLRVEGRVPWRWVSDGTRWRREVQTFDSPAEAVQDAADYYRRNFWARTPVNCEIWCESDSMGGVILGETQRYRLPLMVSRGFSSRTYLWHAAEEIEATGKPTYIYYIGDWDPSGKLIPEVIERTLRGFAPGSEIHFKRLLVTPEQIEQWELPTKPAKRTTHSRDFRGGTVEAEAVPAKVTRRLVREAIEQHLDLHELAVMKEAEESERELIRVFAGSLQMQDYDGSGDDAS